MNTLTLIESPTSLTHTTLTAHEHIGFELGWDYAHYRVSPPAPYAQEPSPLRHGLLAGQAWHNTGERMVGTSTTWIIDWHLPDGSIKHGAWKAGLPMIAMRPHNGKVVLRYWLNGRGYATTEVDENWLLRSTFE